MKEFWTEGSSARQRSWNEQSVYTQYYPTKYELKRQRSTTIEYVESPEQYAANHPIKTAINKSVYYVTNKAVESCHAISTAFLKDLNQGLILANRWINTAIGLLVTLCCLIEWGYILYIPMEMTMRLQELWKCGCSTAVICTICILIYRSNNILHRRYDIAGSLERRPKVVYSLKKTAFMMCKTLLLLYVFLIPHIVKIVVGMLT